MSKVFGMQQVPHVSRQEFTLLDITEDGFVSAPLLLQQSCMHVGTAPACMQSRLFFQPLRKGM